MLRGGPNRGGLGRTVKVAGGGAAAGAAAAAGGGVLGGGGGGPVDWGWVEPAAPSNDLRKGYNAFAPESLRVFPLTHLGRDEHGEAAIICHIELRDRWGDSVKALGPLQVQLYRPEGGVDATSAVQILIWDVALEDERENAASYDPATQTYRVVLVGLPEWIADRVDAEPSEPRVRLELRAVLQTLGANGEERVLRDGMVLDI